MRKQTFIEWQLYHTLVAGSAHTESDSTVEFGFNWTLISDK